jgi:hypothetical protein
MFYDWKKTLGLFGFRISKFKNIIFRNVSKRLVKLLFCL